jgi:hypothetical protein
MLIRSFQLALVCTTFTLAACSGGGDTNSPDVISPGLSYATKTISSLEKTVIAPNITGTYGHYAVCSLSLPPAGFTMDRDCNLFIEGAAPGQHTIIVGMAVSGYNGLGSFSQSFTVVGPKLQYNLQRTLIDATLKKSDGLIWQTPLSVTGGTPKFTDYLPAQGDLLTYKVQGTLVPGLVLNPVTGQLTGTPDSDSLLDSNIYAEIIRNGKTSTIPVAIRTELPTVTFASVLTTTLDTSITAKPTASGLQVGDTVTYELHTRASVTGTCLLGNQPAMTASQVAIDSTTGNVRPSANVKGIYCIPVAMVVTRNGKVATVASAARFEIR